MRIYDELVSWNNVTTTNALILFVFLIFIFWYIFIFMEFKTTSAFINKISTYQDYKCFIPCKKEICTNITKTMRDSNYLVDSLKQPNECIFTFWEFSHIILHMLIGYYYNAYISIGIGVGFEIFEHYVYNCGSFMDLFYNSLGLLIGVSIRSLIK
jgi:hypothetical protein